MADSRLAREADALADAGHEVHVIRRPAGAVWLQADAVHVYGQSRLARAFLAARLAGAHLVYDAAEAQAGARLSRRERFVLHRCSRAVVASMTAARRLQERLRLAERPVVVRDAPVIPHGGPRHAGLRTRIGIDGVPLVLLAASEPARAKAVIERLAEIQGANLVVLSEPAEADALRLAAEKAKVGGRVHVLNRVSPQRLVSCAAEADVALALHPPCEAAALARTVLGYMAAGAPLVATKAPEVEELVDDRVAAWLVDSDDPDAVCAALREALSSSRANGGGTATPDYMPLVALYDQLPPRVSQGTAKGALMRRLVRVRALAGGARELTRRSLSGDARAAFLYGRGRRLRAAGRYDEAAQAFSEALELDRAHAATWLHLGHALRDAARQDEAAEAYRAVVRLDGQAARQELTQAAIGLARCGAKRDARAVLERLERAAPAEPAALEEIAELSVALGDPARALDALRELERVAPPTTERGRLRMRVLEQAGEYTAASDLAQAVGDDATRRRLEGTRRALDPEWAPAAPAVDRAAARSESVVLHLLETALPHATSGYTYRTTTVLAAQRRAGLEPVAVTRLGFPANRRIRDFAPVEVVDGVVHHYLTLPGVARYTSIPADELLTRNVELLTPLVDRLQPAVLHGTTPHFNGLLGLSLRDAFDVPFVYEARGFPEMTWAVRPGGDRTEAYSLRRAAETRCMLEADAVITLSGVMKEQVVSRGVPEESVYVVPHMVDTDAFAPAPKDPELVRKYGLEGQIVVGYVSSLVDYEGVDVLLRAVALLRRRMSNVGCLVVGDGLAMPALRQLASELGIADAVRFTGRIPHSQTADHYALIDLFVVPRRGLEVTRYVTPLKPFEAMAMERCVVVSNLPALTESIGEGLCGRIFEPDDPADLADVLEPLASDDALRASLGSAARRHVIENHSYRLPNDVAAAPLLNVASRQTALAG